jgi:hypothetical protein
MTMASDQQGTWQLRMIHGSVPGQSFRIERDVVSIGRDASNDIAVDEPSVSRRHAELVYRDGWFYIQDLGSANGVMVNGTPVRGSIRVGPGDQIALSRDVVLALEWAPANERTAIMGDTAPTPPQGTRAPSYELPTQQWQPSAPTQQWQPSPPTQPPPLTALSSSGPPTVPPPQQERGRGFPWVAVGLAGCGGILLILAAVGVVGALIYTGVLPTPFRTVPGEPTVVLTLTLPVATPLATLAPTATAMPTEPATLTAVPTPTAVPTDPPTPTAEATAVEATATAEATATPEPTQTPVPTETPLPTATAVPPTATPVPPTATPVPPTATPVPTATTPPTPLSLGHSVDDVACISQSQYRIKFTLYMSGGTGQYFVYRDIESQPIYGPGPATSAPYELIWGARSSAVGTFFVRSGSEIAEDKFYVQTPDCSGF